MRFSDPPRRKPRETIVPMINVVFLLLIFFLMIAQIAPPDPFDVVPPDVVNEGSLAEGEFTLHLGLDGALAYNGVLGEKAALAALGAAKDTYCATYGCLDRIATPPLILRADGRVPAGQVARLLALLSQAGFADVQLVTVQK